MNQEPIAIDLPDDFAPRVVDAVKVARRRRTIRRRTMSAGLAMLLMLGIGIAEHGRSDRTNVAASLAQHNSDLAMATAMAQASDPASVGDYLMPNAAMLVTYGSDYAESATRRSWSYGDQRGYYGGN